MNAQTLSLLAGAVLSLAFAYIPGLESEYQKLDSTRKRLVMAAALLAVTLVIFGLSCAGVKNYVACDQSGAWGLVEVYLLALVANQSAYAITKRPSRIAA